MELAYLYGPRRTRLANRLSERTELALGRLRSAEPRLGQPWPPFDRSRCDLRIRAGRGSGAPARARRVPPGRPPGPLAASGRALDESAEPRLQLVHLRVRRGPAPAQALGVVAAEVRLHVRVAEQQ